MTNVRDHKAVVMTCVQEIIKLLSLSVVEKAAPPLLLVTKRL